MIEEKQQNKKTLVVLFAILALFGFLTYSFVSPYGMFSDLKNDLKTIAPEESVSYTDLNGNPVDLASFKGKPLIINAWATWIPFSQTELPLLIQAQQRYGNAITILAINRMEDTIIIRSFLETFGIQQDGIIFLTDPSDFFYRAIGGYAMPEMVFYRSDGVIQNHIRGTVTESDLNQFIESLIAS